MSNVFKIGVREVPVYIIEVDQGENEQDWEFVFINAGNGVKRMAVF